MKPFFYYNRNYYYDCIHRAPPMTPADYADDPFKAMVRRCDAAVVARGGTSILAPHPRTLYTPEPAHDQPAKLPARANSPRPARPCIFR